MASKMQHRVGRSARAMTTVMAFQKASFVIMSSGRIPRLMSSMTAPPAARASAALAGETAFCAELFGSDIPRASIALAMVFAVYMPPQDPRPDGLLLDERQFAIVELLVGVRADGSKQTHDVEIPADELLPPSCAAASRPGCR